MIYPIRKDDLKCIAWSIFLATAFRLTIELARPTRLTLFENILFFLALLGPSYIMWLYKSGIDPRRSELDPNIAAAIAALSLLAGILLLFLTWDNTY